MAPFGRSTSSSIVAKQIQVLGQPFRLSILLTRNFLGTTPTICLCSTKPFGCTSKVSVKSLQHLGTNHVICMYFCCNVFIICVYIYTYCNLHVIYLSSRIPTKMNSLNPPTISGQTFCHPLAEAKRVTAVKCNVPNCPMPIVPPAAISPHDTWWKKPWKAWFLAPGNPSSS